MTLVELSTVVVLVGILSTLANVAYRRWVRASRQMETSSVIDGIAQAQEAYNSEVGHYADVSGSLDNLYPAHTPGPFKTAWGGPCSGCALPWTTLTFVPDAPVEYGYATTSSTEVLGASSQGGPIHTSHWHGAMGVAPPSGGEPSPIPLPNPTGPYFIVVAKGDTDGDGFFSLSLYYSETHEIIVQNDGE
jgi:type II secretory pathway pseudopilin PulG